MNPSQFDQLVAATCGVKVTDRDVALADLGVDSLAQLSLLMAVEDAYGIEIDPAALADPALGTPAGLWAYAEGEARADAVAGLSH